MKGELNVESERETERDREWASESVCVCVCVCVMKMKTAVMKECNKMIAINVWKVRTLFVKQGAKQDGWDNNWQ